MVNSSIIIGAALIKRFEVESGSWMLDSCYKHCTPNHRIELRFYSSRSLFEKKRFRSSFKII